MKKSTYTGEDIAHVPATLEAMCNTRPNRGYLMTEAI